MAMTNKLSEVVKTFIDKEPGKFPVVEIEFKFMRYRLTIDNIDIAEKLKELSYMKYGVAREDVEADIMERFRGNR